MKYLKIFTFLFCLCIQTILQSVPTYTISEFDIQELEQDSKKELILSNAWQINNLGQVVGYCTYHEKNNEISIQKYAIYHWEKETGFRIVIADTEYKRFPVINDAGIVAWTTHYGKGTGGSSAYFWDPLVKKIESLPNGGLVNAINNYNEILTNSFLVKIKSENIVNYSPIFVDAFNYYSEEYKKKIKKEKHVYFIDKNKGLAAVNNSSKVVGFYNFYYDIGYYMHGFVWDVKKGIQDLGNGICPNDINDNEQIVGCTKNCAFLLENEHLTMIKSNARAIAINNLGDVVGNMRLQADSPKETAFIFIEGTVHDLLSLVVDNDGWLSLEHAADINDSGQIVGYGYRHGKLTAFMLTPHHF